MQAQFRISDLILARLNVELVHNAGDAIIVPASARQNVQRQHSPSDGSQDNTSGLRGSPSCSCVAGCPTTRFTNRLGFSVSNNTPLPTVC